MRRFLLAVFLTGCVFQDPSAVDAKIRICQAESRHEYYVNKKTEAEAIQAYRACLHREGLR